MPALRRRLAVGITVTVLTTGLAAAPAMAQEDLPASSTGVTAPNGWTPEGSFTAWSEFGRNIAWAAQYNPIGAAAMTVMASTVMPLSFAAPYFPWCGPFANIDSPTEGCSG